MNPYESSLTKAEWTAKGFRIVRVTLACVFAAVLMLACYVSYEIGFAHGYQDGNSDRVGKYPVIMPQHQDGGHG